jgi:folate-dependent phosphoribosylglycinamide formyltransferase PurN
MKWIAFFSQTGSELYEVCEQLKKYPDVIVTNNQELNNITEDLIGKSQMRFLPEKPTAQDYYTVLTADAVVTLHGWLRIVPGAVCKTNEIYNGHPGLINKHPQLKGKDPQAKAVELQLETSGCVIHRVTAEVDDGEILVHRETSIKGLTEEETITHLHGLSVELWVKFLRTLFNGKRS